MFCPKYSINQLYIITRRINKDYLIWSCLTNSKNLSSNPLKRLWSRDFYPERLQELTVVLKYYTGSRLGHVEYIYVDFSSLQWEWTLEKIDQWQRGRPIQKLWWRFRAILRISKGFHRSKQNIYIYFSLRPSRLWILKPAARVYKVLIQFHSRRNIFISRPSPLKGQCHEKSCFRFFSCIIFPQAPEKNITAISNFFENWRRYSEVKVHHRYQRPPVSTIPAANFATGTAGVVVTGGK